MRVWLFFILMLLLICARAADLTPSVWDGVYTSAQASRGMESFGTYCGRCHNPDSESSKLWGEEFWNGWGGDTLDNFYGYVRDNMPNNNPGALPDRTYSDIVAFILNRNRLPAGKLELSGESVKNVAIVARESFAELPSGALARVQGCLMRGSDGWLITQAGRPVRAGRGSVAPSVSGDRSYVLKFVTQSLDGWIGHTVVATGLLIGEGGQKGLNLMNAVTVAEDCPRVR